jgi:alpha-tubulin suppressor-like RCC1 family protein
MNEPDDPGWSFQAKGKLTVSRQLLAHILIAFVLGACGGCGSREGGEGGSSIGYSAKISSGYGHTCMLNDDGQILCWGHNAFGQLGSDDYGDWKTSLVADLPGRPTAVTAGAYHTCALIESGEVYCWGQNDYGQLGDGTNEDRSSPVRVRSLPSAVVQLDAGSTHTCAMIADGSSFCWGQNNCGQLGDGTQTDRSEAVQVLDAPGGGAMIAAGGVFSCILTEAGELYCWGDGSSGRFAAKGESCVLAPLLVKTGAVMRGLAAGEYHLCAIRPDASIACWGSLSTEIDTTPESPLIVSAPPDAVTQLDAGAGYECALSSSGAVLCWGDNYFGQLGGPVDAASQSPVEVDGMTGSAIAIATGSGHACAMLADGTVHCWGDGSSGQLGGGSQRWK